jgi:hypothetical protein
MRNDTPPQGRKEHKRFATTALFCSTVLAAVLYAPAFSGRVAVPANFVTDFAAWQSTRPQERTISRPVNYGDLVTLFYPWRVFVDHALKVEHTIPAWNPHILGGTPLIASAQAAVFYPVHILLYPLPVSAAWALKLFLNVVLAGFFAAMFVDALGADRLGSLAAGAIYALCGFMTAWQGQAIADAAIWLPLVCWSLAQIYHTAAPRYCIVAALAFALPVLAGHPETASHITAVGVTFFLWQLLTGDRNPRFVGTRLICFFVVGVLALGIAAIQVIPTVEWLGHLNHTLDLRWGVLNRNQLLTFFSRDLSATPNVSNIDLPESAGYAGIATLLLAPFALWYDRKRAFYFVLVILFAVEISVGWEPGNWLASHTPLIKGIKNWRLLGVADFALAVLAGLGLSQLVRQVRTHWTTAFVAAAAALVVAIGVWKTHTHLITTPDSWHGPASGALLFAAAAVLISLRVGGKISGRQFGAMTLLLISADLLSYAFGYIAFVRPAEIFPAAPVLNFLQEHDPANNRVVNFDAYTSNAETVYGLDGVAGWDITLKLVKGLVSDLEQPALDSVGFTPETILANPNDRRLDLLNARYFVTSIYNKTPDLAAADPQRFRLVFTDDVVKVFENRRALPRAWFVPAAGSAVEIIPLEADQLKRVRDPGFDPVNSVVLGALPAGLEAEQSATADQPATLKRADNNRTQSTWRLETIQPGIFVLSQIFYPGWQAEVDNQPAPLVRANYGLTGVPVRAGSHDIRFSFRPASLRIGMVITIASVLLSVAVIIVGRFGSGSVGKSG